MPDAQLSTTSTLKKLSNYPGDYNLYEIAIDYQYDLDALTGPSARNDQEYTDSVVAQVFPGIPITMEAPSFGCSAFRAQVGSSQIMGRNYDFKQDTSALLVRTKPEDGYASIAFAALNNLGANVADASQESRMVAALGPFACLDGINEKGVSIAVLTLDSEPTEQNTGKPTLNTSLAIRIVLDRAASTQEAIALLSSYDMHAASGRDYHFFISDASGDSVVIEYDPLDPERALVVTPARQITNYYAMYADEVEPYQKNGVFGHGKERALAIADVLDKAETVTCDTVWEALRASSQEPNPEDITSNTQWSIAFDNTALSADIVLRRNWDDVYRFCIQREG